MSKPQSEAEKLIKRLNEQFEREASEDQQLSARLWELCTIGVELDRPYRKAVGYAAREIYKKGRKLVFNGWTPQLLPRVDISAVAQLLSFQHGRPLEEVLGDLQRPLHHEAGWRF